MLSACARMKSRIADRGFVAVAWAEQRGPAVVAASAGQGRLREDPAHQPDAGTVRARPSGVDTVPWWSAVALRIRDRQLAQIVSPAASRVFDIVDMLSQEKPRKKR